MRKNVASSINLVKGNLSSEEIREVCKFYSIGVIDNWKNNDRGTRNRGFVLDDNYYLIVHGRKTFDQANAIAQVANIAADTVAIARPLMGKGGYTFDIDGHPSLLTAKIRGRHHIEIAHTDKHSIPRRLHISLARFYWSFQKALSSVPDHLKEKLEPESVCNVEEYPVELPESFKPLTKYDPGEEPQFKYHDLTHDDMERCNILSVRNSVSGVVDLDALRMSDVLYQFGHFVFNFAFCDPEADARVIDIYINEAIKAGVISHDDIPELYANIYKFMIGDAIEFKIVHDSAVVSQQRATDMELLVDQYCCAMERAKKFFENEFI